MFGNVYVIILLNVGVLLMKLIINYDFFNAIRNVNEPLTTYKVVRNNKQWLYIWVPTWTLINVLATNNLSFSLSCSSYEYIFILGLNMAIRKGFNIDIDKNIAIEKLKLLVGQFKELDISTTYDLLLESKLYEKQSKLIINEDKLPEILEKKYILVPTKDGKINSEVSIEQEHIIGSKEYILSLGKPRKEHSYSYAFT